MPYHKLDVYQKAYQLALDVHKLSLGFPQIEQYELARQLRRSSKSISANIVEGYGRRKYKAEFIRFLIYAHSSCNETIEWVEYIQDCYKNLEEISKTFLNQLDELGRKINRFIGAVEKKHNS